MSSSIKTPNIPSMPSSTPREVRAAFDALKGWFRQVDALGGISTTNDVATAVKDAAGEGGSGGSGSASPPPNLVGFTATGGFSQILLEWDAVDYGGGYVEIWRAATNDIGDAVLVGTTSAGLYADTPPNSALSVTYYYWARIVRVVNGVLIKGPFNATAGTAASTSDDPEYLLQIAAEKWQSSHDYALGDLSMPTAPNGYCYEVTVDGGSSGETEPTWPTTIGETVSDGDLTWTCKAAFSFETFFKLALVDGVPHLALKELFLADGIIKRAMIQDAAIDNAKIANLSAAKLLAGIITASGIYVGNDSRIHIDGANQRIVINDGTRDVLRIGNLGTSWGMELFDASGNTIVSAGGGVPSTAVTGLGSLATLSGFTVANIDSYFETLAVGEALLANAAVSTLKIGENAVTVPVSAFTASGLTLTTSYQTAQSVTINTLGQPAVLSFTALLTLTGSSFSGATTDIYAKIVDGYGDVLSEQIITKAFAAYDSKDGGTYNWKLGAPICLTHKYSPTSGSQTISIQLKYMGDGAPTVSVRAFTALGVKR